MRHKLIPAALSGLVLPGAGQIYNGERVKGAVLIAATLAILGAALYVTWDAAVGIIFSPGPGQAAPDIYGLLHSVVRINRVFYLRALLGLLAIWVYSIVDAYLKAGDGCRRGGTT